MNERVLYRKYRPAQWSEVLGQPHIVAVLKTAAEEHTIAHAYLFSGSRGTGKTSVARIFAAAIDCTPTDLYEIDAASNRGIDEIRNLKEGVRTAPARGGYKVYIIDEAHMLTGPAFNALLKTIEEPPAHAVFILATTEFEKVPVTITSRTQRFLFKKISKIHIIEKLSKIAKEEKIKIDDSALEIIA
ncbi:MAG: polymerase III subunit gamma/tau protein, partial [Parcubacteria group bacterium GW2011_GWF1_52_5]